MCEAGRNNTQVVFKGLLYVQRTCSLGFFFIASQFHPAHLRVPGTMHHTVSATAHALYSQSRDLCMKLTKSPPPDTTRGSNPIPSFKLAQRLALRTREPSDQALSPYVAKVQLSSGPVRSPAVRVPSAGRNRLLASRLEGGQLGTSRRETTANRRLLPHSLKPFLARGFPKSVVGDRGRAEGLGWWRREKGERRLGMERWSPYWLAHVDLRAVDGE